MTVPVIDWMPWQLDAIDSAETGSLDISSPRQNGKSAIALEVARRAALRGECVVYFTDGHQLALEAHRRIEAMQRADNPASIRKVRRSRSECSAEIGGTIDFCSHRSAHRAPTNRDRVICDATPELPPADILLVANGPLLRVDVQLEPGLPGTDMIRYGMDADDDPASEATWRKANPALDTVISIDKMRMLFDVLPLERFKVDCLNVPR